MFAATRRRLHFMIAREQYDRPGLRWIFKAVECIPVERGRRPEQALRAAQRALEAGNVVAMFPHGKIHLDADPPLKLKGGVAWLAKQTGCPVYGVRIEGVRGEGLVVSAVFLRSRVRLRACPAVNCTEDVDTTACLTAIAKCIEGCMQEG
jgi:1-acyl-sn-glycerol-3-phosphate acyltransferase